MIKQKDVYLQHDCWVCPDFELCCDSHKSSTINFCYFNWSVVERLGDMCPYRFYPATVSAPWRVELDEPHTLIAYINKFVA